MATYQLNGTTFNEGDSLIISTPELGTIEVRGTIRGFTRAGIVGLSFGFVKTPLPCRSSNQRDDVNARMELYSTGDKIQIGLFYCCSCGYNVHNHALEWMATMEGNRITANAVGTYLNMPHNHPLIDGYQHLAPRPARIETPPPPLPAPVVKVKPVVELKPEPATVKKAEFIPSKNVNKKTGQIGLF